MTAADSPIVFAVHLAMCYQVGMLPSLCFRLHARVSPLVFANEKNDVSSSLTPKFDNAGEAMTYVQVIRAVPS